MDWSLGSPLVTFPSRHTNRLNFSRKSIVCPRDNPLFPPFSPHHSLLIRLPIFPSELNGRNGSTKVFSLIDIIPKGDSVLEKVLREQILACTQKEREAIDNNDVRWSFLITPKILLKKMSSLCSKKTMERNVMHFQTISSIPHFQRDPVSFHGG